jgi:hypothetical protein
MSEESTEIVTGSQESYKVPVIGLYQTQAPNATTGGGQQREEPGRLALFGDSSCLDSASGQPKNCFWLIKDLLMFTSQSALTKEFQQYVFFGKIF